jgi:ABC-type polysaccharide/polyol phosphate transport system ATPase subunit
MVFYATCLRYIVRFCHYPRSKAGAAVLVLLQAEKGVFTWESAGGDTSSAYMKDISFEARPGTLTMVVGSVASGKTSLLSALIGQMERLQGTVAVGGRVAYVAQTAWIINDSVQVGYGV